MLATTEKVDADLLVVEGWMPDHVAEQVIHEFNSGKYQWIVATGGPLQLGGYLCGYRTYAAAMRATLIHLGVDAEKIVAVPAPDTKRDRTYASAVALRNWLERSHYAVKGINLCSLNVHARRSHYLFRLALGDRYPLGILALDDGRVGENDWWTSSEGVRRVIGEFIAMGYAYLVFSP